MAEQKLNIVFTGDVSQLNKAIQSAENELTNFEKKLRDSLGTEAFAQINQSVEALKQKLSSLQAIDIKANPEKLFAAVREVSSELGKLKDSEVLLKLNDSKVLAQIQNVDNLLSSLTASIRIDANVKTEIDRIKSQLSGLTVNIGADASVAETAIKSIQSKLSLLQDEKFILSADGRQAESVIDEIFSDLKTLKDTKILITADGTPADNVIDQIRSDLQTSLRGNVLINTDDLQRKIQQLGEVKLGVDTSEVDTAIKAVREKLSFISSIDVKANPQQALTAINEVLSQIAKIKSSELVLSSDNADVLADINQIQARLQEVKSTIRISADLDTSNLEALLKPLSTQVSVDVNTKAAEAELKALLQQVKNLKGQDILINLDGTQVIKTVDAIERELLQLQAKLKTATNPADIARLTQSLQLFKNSLSGTNVNQFSTSMNRAQNATFAFSQVLREAPAFAFSFQTGILALSNNLPILADRLKEARAAGASFGQIAGGIAKSLVSLPGILTIASTALIFLGDKLFNTGKQAKEAAKDLATIGGTISDATASVQGDIARVQALAEAFRNSAGSFEQQKRIIDQLKETNESYFGDLEAGKTTYEEITKAANAYTDALVNQAIINGLSDAISDLSREYGTLLIKYGEQTKAANEARLSLQKINKEQATNVQGLTGQNREVNTAQNRFNKLNAELGNTGKALGEIGTRIKEFREQIGQAVGQQLKIKPLTFDEKDFTDETDKIIARARAFVQQFGEIFVTPDLTESFTNTRDKILSASKKLLDDVSKSNLQIRIPVQVITEADFIKENVETPLPKEKIDELHKAFFEQLKAEFQEPVKIDANFQLVVDNDKILKDIQDAVKSGGFDKALDFIDLDSTRLGLQGLTEDAKLAAKEISEALVPAFQDLFQAILKGEDPLKAFFSSIIKSINQVIQRLITAAIQAAILSAFSGGTLSFGSVFGRLFGGGQANLGRGFIGGSVANTGGELTARVSGTDLVFVLNQGSGRIGRTQ